LLLYFLCLVCMVLTLPHLPAFLPPYLTSVFVVLSLSLTHTYPCAHWVCLGGHGSCLHVYFPILWHTWWCHKDVHCICTTLAINGVSQMPTPVPCPVASGLEQSWQLTLYFHSHFCWPGLRSSCLHLSNAGITDVHHHTQLPLLWLFSSFFAVCWTVLEFDLLCRVSIKQSKNKIHTKRCPC
jgi:hypothetical protein